MIDHELTDPTGSALTITHNVDGVWVTATDTRDEVTVGPFPVTSLTEAVTVESDAEVSGDLMDGGVTAAAIEAEVVSPERARSLVQENDELRARIGRVEEARDLYRRDALTEERLHGEARRFALAWKETARELLKEKQVYLTGFHSAIEMRNDARADCNDALRREKAEQDRAVEAEARVMEFSVRPLGPRPLTADDITDEMVERALVRHEQAKAVWPSLGAMRSALISALTEPTRPEGAEELARMIALADVGEWDCGDLADALLATGRVRLTGAES